MIFIYLWLDTFSNIQICYYRESQPPVHNYVKKSTHYKMDHKNRGVALIFCHDEYKSDLNLQPNCYVQKDCKTLELCLKHLGYDVLMFQDLNHNEIMSHVQTCKYSLFVVHNCDNLGLRVYFCFFPLIICIKRVTRIILIN